MHPFQATTLMMKHQSFSRQKQQANQVHTEGFASV
jgi:hypothetical protein